MKYTWASGNDDTLHPPPLPQLSKIDIHDCSIGIKNGTEDFLLVYSTPPPPHQQTWLAFDISDIYNV